MQPNVLVFGWQEIRNSGAVGYKYITVDEDDAANVIYANNVLLHLSGDQIPRGAAVSRSSLSLHLIYYGSAHTSCFAFNFSSLLSMLSQNFVLCEIQDFDLKATICIWANCTSRKRYM